MQRIIKISHGETRMQAWRLAEPVDFELCNGEHIAIVGPNGGGKTMLVDMITGRHPLIGNGIEYDFHPSKKNKDGTNTTLTKTRPRPANFSKTHSMKQEKTRRNAGLCKTVYIHCSISGMPSTNT